MRDNRRKKLHAVRLMMTGDMITLLPFTHAATSISGSFLPGFECGKPGILDPNRPFSESIIGEEDHQEGRDQEAVSREQGCVIEIDRHQGQERQDQPAQVFRQEVQVQYQKEDINKEIAGTKGDEEAADRPHRGEGGQVPSRPDLG